jgi:DNA polymerase-3 subunit gamma/tau
VDDEALTLIARAAEGSVRDGLSILDQAIAHAGSAEGGELTAQDVRAMLGLADRLRIFDLLEKLLCGDLADLLRLAAELYHDGADPQRILIDLSEIVHILTRRKISGDEGGAGLGESERARAAEMEAKLSLPVLSRCWQMFLKAIDECGRAPSPPAAMEMALVRMACAADLPSPEELARALGDNAGSGGSEGAGRKSGSERLEEKPALAAGNDGEGAQASAAWSSSADAGPAAHEGRGMERADGPGGGPGGPGGQVVAMAGRGGGPANAVPPQAMPALVDEREAAFLSSHDISISSMDDIARLVGERSGITLKLAVEDYVMPVAIAPGRVEIELAEAAPPSLAGDIRKVLNEAMSADWVVVLCDEGGGETISQRNRRHQKRLEEAAIAHPLVREALGRLRGARISHVKQTGPHDKSDVNSGPEKES